MLKRSMWVGILTAGCGGSVVECEVYIVEGRGWLNVFSVRDSFELVGAVVYFRTPWPPMSVACRRAER